MAGKKKKSRRFLTQSSQTPHDTVDGAGPSTVEEATNIASKADRKRGRLGAAQRKKRQDEPESHVRINNGTAIDGRTEQSQDRGLWQSKKNKSRYYYTMTINTEEEEEEEEQSSEYTTAEEEDSCEEDAGKNLKPEDTRLMPCSLFEENDSHQEVEDENRYMEILDTKIKTFRHLKELLDALDDSEDAEAPSMGSVEPIVEKSCYESVNCSNSLTNTNKPTGVCTSNLDDNNAKCGRDTGISRLTGSGRENAFGVSAAVDSGGQGEDKSRLLLAHGECTKESTVAERSSSGFGLGSVFKSVYRKFAGEGNISIPKSESLSRRQGEAPKIQLGIPMKEQRRFELLERRFEMSPIAYYYDGGITDNGMCGYGRLVLKDEEYIAGNWYANRLMGLKSCQLHHRQKTYNIVKRLDDYLLTIYEDRFVAVVTLNSMDDLDFTRSIEQLKDAFFKKISITRILQDELTNRRKESLSELQHLLENMTGEHADPINRAETFIILRKYSSSTPSKNLNDFLNDPTVPSDLKNAAINLQTRDSEYRRLNSSVAFLKNRVVQFDLMNMMANIYKDNIENHRKMLISRCSSSLPSLISELWKLDDSKIAYITRADVDVFYQLASQPFFQHYEGCVENLIQRFTHAFDKVLAHNHPSTSFDDFPTSSTKIIPIMSPILEFLVKSMWEIISEIIEVADGCEYGDLLECNSGNWRIQEEIKFPEEQDNNEEHVMESAYEPSQNKSYYFKSLEVQYKLIFKILKRVFPDNYVLNKRINYTFYVLGQDLSQNGDTQAISDLRPGLPDRFKELSEERLVWLYVLDRAIHKVFKDDPQYRLVLKRYDPLLQGAIRFIESSPTESHEAFRALIHNVVKLVMSSAPYIKLTTEQPGIDVEVLFEQISTASKNIGHDPLVFSSFRDLITEYNKYLSLRHFIKIKAAPGYFSSQLSQMMQTFMCIVETSLRKSVPTADLVAYFRCLNDFVDDFRNIDFLGMWYIKPMDSDNQAAMEKVENKLSAGKNCSYLVTDIDKFVAEYTCRDRPPPHHYIIQIVHELLGCIEKCLDKQWQSDDDQLQLVQLKTAGIMLDAVRRSFMYLKEQPDYVDFRAFKKESVDPFVRLVDECSTLTDLKNRANIVKESFWYLRKMDEIDIDQAMILLRDANTSQISDKLLNGYSLYLSWYNKYIETYTSVLSGGHSHSEGLDAVKKMLKEVEPLLFSQWTEEFKTEEIPVILAGLSAIWSILVSKDLSGTGKFLKPHCIQILCILRLLSVDESTGTENHLAQVLTGQGKSVVLGLLSSVLALTGHKVKVLCYSEYLSSRDQADFKEFFQTFRVDDKINYGTFEDMAREFLKPTYNGSRTSLCQLVEDKVLNHANWSKMGSVTTESENTVLLIDEVDVFFTDNFYGNTYPPCVLLTFKGLAAVQEKIWSLASSKQLTKQEIVDHTKAFMRNEAAAGNISDLTVFLSKPGTFSLLTDEGGDLTVKNYTNQSLFDEHLLLMISDAVSVAADQCRTWQFMINSEGMICSRPTDNVYDEEWNPYLRSYYTAFTYFKLKGSHYDHKNFQNYGNLLLDAGEISYSHIPSQFRLILGVSGTIKNLSEYEKTGIKSYNINNTTILPSFYGESNLIFNKLNNFHYYDEEQEWLKKIYNGASNIVLSNRAVLIFFESDLTIKLITKEYRTKFDRLNEISTNTEPHLRDRYIEEAGLPGAVTLATRAMGRGVDYKSSFSVEKHGGVHVIQTFFSTDIKEEIQIKGRTARKDNKGSYEIVICGQHLAKEDVISVWDLLVLSVHHTYATLDDIRQKLSIGKGKTVSEKIEKSERNHKTTMEYFGLT